MGRRGVPGPGKRLWAGSQLVTRLDWAGPVPWAVGKALTRTQRKIKRQEGDPNGAWASAAGEGEGGGASSLSVDGASPPNAFDASPPLVGRNQHRNPIP